MLIPALALTAVVVSGCLGTYRGDMTSATSKAMMQKSMIKDLDAALAASPLRFKVSFVADAIAPDDADFYKTEIVKHNYESDRLPGGATGFIRGRLEERLKTDRRVEENKNLRFVSLDLKDVDLKILEGNFISGRFGRYYARIVGQARVSGFDGTVYMDAPVSAEFQGNRESFTGRDLGVDKDWHHVKLALLQAVDILALNLTQKLMDGKKGELNLDSLSGNSAYGHRRSGVFAP